MARQREPKRVKPLLLPHLNIRGSEKGAYMKIILCYPPKREYTGYGQEKRWLPLGIASLGAYIKREYPDIEIVLLDLFNYTVDEAFYEICKHIKYNDVNLVGYTVFTEQRFSTWELAKKVKKATDEIVEIINVVGGPHAYLMAEQIYSNYDDIIDVVIKGEGELAWISLIKGLKNGIAWEGIIEGENIQDLNTLPYAIDGFDLFANTNKLIEAEAPIIFSRGCTDYCSFCSTTKFWKGYRSRRAENVFFEMCAYYIRYNIKKFKFHDDASTADIENWKILCKKIINEMPNAGWEYEITARADQFDDELIDLLAQSGCKKVAVGIESGNEVLRKAMNKNLNMELAKSNMKKLMQVGIEVVMLFIIGYPEESDATIEETIELIKEVNPTSFCCQPLMIFPGTKVYRDLVQKGWITDEYWLKDIPQPYYLREQNWSKIQEWTQKVLNCNKKINILIAAPVRQNEEKFKLYIDSLNKLEVPSNVNVVRFFILHNSSHLIEYISPQDQYQEVNTNDEYRTDENTHHWQDHNLQFIAYVKNQLVDIMLKSGFDYIFMVDSDLILHPKTLVSLLDSKKDIVSEVFWTKWNKDDILEMPNAWDYDHYSFFKDTISQYRKGNVYECGGTGACILIHRKVFEKGVNYNPINNVSFWGEDRAFSIRAKVAGFDLFVDTKYPAIHLYRDSDVDKFREGGDMSDG